MHHHPAAAVAYDAVVLRREQQPHPLPRLRFAAKGWRQRRAYHPPRLVGLALALLLHDHGFDNGDKFGSHGVRRLSQPLHVREKRGGRGRAGHYGGDGLVGLTDG